MPGKRIDTLKKIKYKAARLQGDSIKDSLLKAGYSPATAHQSGSNSIAKHCERELAVEVKASDITVDWVVNQLTKELVAKDAKASDRIRVTELLGKYLNMFRDAQTTQVQFNINDTIERLREPMSIDITSCSASG